MQNIDRLSDYQIAEAFGGTLSLIYKAKMEELNDIAAPMYDHLDRLAIPQVPEWHREFAGQMARLFYRETIEAIEHIQKIRRIYKKMKNASPTESLDVQKAKAVPIASLYDWTVKHGFIPCPFHTDKTPSMKINKNNRAHCFSCGFDGDGIALWMAMNKCNFKKAVEDLNKL